jgi:hypothetical protein
MPSDNPHRTTTLGWLRQLSSSASRCSPATVTSQAFQVFVSFFNPTSTWKAHRSMYVLVAERGACEMGRAAGHGWPAVWARTENDRVVSLGSLNQPETSETFVASGHRLR